MAKFEKLKTYNILVFALVPLLIIALVATVTLAAMTDRAEGNNVIEIAGAGTLTTTFVAGGLYPGSTCNVTMQFAYNDTNMPAGSSVVLDADTFQVTNIKYSTNDGTSYADVNEGSLATYLTCALASDVTVQNGSSANGVVQITVGPGTGEFITVSPADRLTYSVTHVQIAFSINVIYGS